MGAGVHGTEVLLECHCTHERRHHHVAARLNVAGLTHRNRQGAGADAHAFQSDAVAHRVIGGAEIGLDVVRHRIHAGGGGHVGGQGERKFGIGEYRLGQQTRREHDPLDVRVVLRHHARAAHFGTGAAGGRQRDEVRQIAVNRSHLRVIPHVFHDVAFVRSHHGDHLRDVQAGTTAEADDAVGPVCARSRGAFHDLSPRGVAVNAGEHGDIEPGAETVAEVGHDGQGGEPLVRDDDRAFDTGFAQMIADQLARAGAELDGGGETELGDGHGGKVKEIECACTAPPSRPSPTEGRGRGVHPHPRLRRGWVRVGALLETCS